MYDIFCIGSYNTCLKEKFPFLKQATSISDASSKSLTSMFWVVWDDIVVDSNFNFDITLKEWDQEYIHVFKNGEFSDGIFLIPKSANVSKREEQYRFFTNKKESDVVASIPRPYDIFTVDTYEEYLYALEHSTTDLFWATSRNIKISEQFNFSLYFPHYDLYNRNENHVFIHRVQDKDLYNGLFLLSKNKQLSKREIDKRHIVNRKEWNIVASGPVEYDKFVVDTYEDYTDALEKASTEMVWIIPKEAEVEKDFKFDLYFSHDDVYNRNIHHSFAHLFRNEKTYNGINLVVKSKVLNRKEIEYRSIIEYKPYDITASKLKPYDAVFISYNEPNADANYERLRSIYPNAKRVHGVKGIHNAHIRAAQLADTEMFWVIDGDAYVLDDFKFDYQVPIWERKAVHVWRSKNPINGLVYGYGGLKLLPRKLTLTLDVNSTDMTTSISKEFKIIHELSNITAFNTDPYNTWKSAFRECVKLSSKVIDRQQDDETAQRLEVWKTVAHGDFAEYAIKGAKDAEQFVAEGNNVALINDFDYLQQLFNK